MQSVGTILRKERKRQKLSMEEIYKKIRIHPDFIKALENDDFDVFSCNAQIKGFLSNYSIFLNLDSRKIIAFWKRDFYRSEIDEQKKQSNAISNKVPRFILRPYIFLLSISLVAAFVFIGYLFFAFYSLNKPPFLEIYEPQADLITANKTVHFLGKIDKYSKLILNGKEINYDEEGGFGLEVDLAEGENRFIFTAINRIGGRSEAERTVVRRSED